MGEAKKKREQESNIILTGGDGISTASGRVDLRRTTEQRPCFMCKRWERDETRLVQHIKSAPGVVLHPDGTFQAARRAGDGAEPMRLKISEVGYCRLDGSVTECDATCENWDQVTRREDMRQRLSLFDRIKNTR